MSDTAVTWRGLTFGGTEDTGIDVVEVAGWDDLEADTSLDQPRARGHGDHPGELYSRARIVTVRGQIASRARRDELARAIAAVSGLSSVVERLTIDTFGQPLHTGARLIRRALPVVDDYASGFVPFTLQWRCPDPLRYGPARASVTGLPTAGGGLAWPVFAAGTLDWGPPGDPGQVTVYNEGTADAALQLDVVGDLPAGFEVSDTLGRRLRYERTVPPGQRISIDTDAGSVRAEGTADRRGDLTIADWITVPAGTQLALQFTSLGGAHDPAAELTVRYAPTYW